MKNAVRPTFLKKFLKFAQIFKVFDNSPFSPKARSMAELCRRKRDLKLSAVFVTVRFRIVFSVYRRKSGVKLRVFGESAELN
jgi:hypothetical protein